MYRDHLVAARYRQQQIAQELGATAVPASLAHIYSRRVGRIAAGVAALGALLAMAIHFLFTLDHREIALYLPIAWGAAALAYGIGRWVGGALLRRRVAREYATSGDIFIDLGRLDALKPQQFMLAHVHQHERLALQVPLLAAALLTPLSLHLLIGVLWLGVSVSTFGQWIITSMVLVGHAHITLALFALFHAARVQRELDQGVKVSGASRGGVALLWTVGASAVPGIVMLCVPPILVAITGLVFVPWLFHWASRTAHSERAVLMAHGFMAKDQGLNKR
ncbi:MAG: hypothetical protein JRH20_12415 [Deltaproteobacteria bacterium]|nr:hypothetical protein [Deltaproteobacteria bacterium]